MGRIFRHANLNDIFRRALIIANVPAHLELCGLVLADEYEYYGDRKRTSSMSLLLWKMDTPSVYDATCVDTLAPSYLLSTGAYAIATVAKAAIFKRQIKAQKQPFVVDMFISKQKKASV